MDEEIDRDADGVNRFFTDLEGMREGEGDGSDQGGMRRRAGFNEVIENLYDDNADEAAADGGYAQAARRK